MSWTAPKTAWGVELVGSADLNRIEENIAELHKGNGHTVLAVITPPTVSPFNMDFPNQTDQTYQFTHSGSDVVGFISAVDRQPGNVIHLVMNNPGGAVVFFHNAGTPDPGYARLRIHNGVNFGNAELDHSRVITFVYTGVDWLSNFVSAT